MHNPTLHTELKTALDLLGSNISKFARELGKPNGSKGVSHTTVIRVAQGTLELEWVEDEIKKVIAKAHKERPDFYQKTNSVE